MYERQILIMFQQYKVTLIIYLIRQKPEEQILHQQLQHFLLLQDNYSYRQQDYFFLGKVSYDQMFFMVNQLNKCIKNGMKMNTCYTIICMISESFHMINQTFTESTYLLFKGINTYLFVSYNYILAFFQLTIDKNSIQKLECKECKNMLINLRKNLQCFFLGNKSISQFIPFTNERI